jgi:hypothetical protein
MFTRLDPSMSISTRQRSTGQATLGFGSKSPYAVREAKPSSRDDGSACCVSVVCLDSADPGPRSWSFLSETIRTWRNRRQLEPPLASSVEEDEMRLERWVGGRVAVEAPCSLDAGGAGAAPILVRRRGCGTGSRFKSFVTFSNVRVRFSFGGDACQCSAPMQIPTKLSC